MIFSQNRLINIDEHAEGFAEINEFYDNISTKNAPSILEVLQLAESVEYNFDLIFEGKSEEWYQTRVETINKNLKAGKITEDEAEKEKEKLVEEYKEKKKADKDSDNPNEDKSASTPNTKEEKPAEKKPNAKSSRKEVGFDTESIKGKLLNLIHRFVEAVAGLFEKVQNKLRKVILNDKKILDKYSKYIDNWDSKYKKGFEGVKVPKGYIITDQDVDFEKIMAEFSIADKIVSNFAGQIEGASGEDKVSTIKAEFEKALKENAVSNKGLYKNLKDVLNSNEEETIIPTQEQLTEIKKMLTIGMDTILNGFDVLKKKSANTYKNIERGINNDLAKAKKDDSSSLGTMKLKALMDIYKAGAKQAANDFSFICKTVIESYKICRKVFIAYGKYARDMAKGGSEEEQNNEENNTNEAYAFAGLYEGSDADMKNQEYKLNQGSSKVIKADQVKEVDPKSVENQKPSSGNVIKADQVKKANENAVAFGESSDKFIDTIFGELLMTESVADLEFAELGA